MTFLDQLMRLCAAPGVSGFEAPVVALIQEMMSSLGYQPVIDRLGNLRVHIPGQGPRVAVFAHMDEVGLIVRKIDQNGFLLVERIGGTSEHVLLGQRVQVWTNEGSVPGIVGALPMHLANSHAYPSLAEMYIDIGVSSRSSVEACGIEIGSPITYQPVFEALDGRVASKSLDDRAGCAVLVQLAEKISFSPVQADIFLAFIVQEETALRGAVPVMYDIQPDYAIGVDATLAFDSPDLQDGQTQVQLGGGVVFKVMDHIRGSGLGFIAHPELRRHLEKLAHDQEIPYQREVITGLSTAAMPLPYIRSGLPVAGVSFPLRYAHSPVELVDLRDLECMLALLELSLRNPWLPG